MDRKEPIKKKSSTIRYGRWFKLEVAYSLPPGHTRGTKNRYPVLCFLHGDKECSVGPDKGKNIRVAMGVHGPLSGSDFQPPDKRFRPASKWAMKNFIVVCPQLPYEGGWTDEHNRKSVADIIRRIHKELNGDPKRTFLTGFSYGGDGVLGISTATKKMGWRAIWIVDPTIMPTGKPVQPTFLCIRSTLTECIEAYKKLGFNEYRKGLSADYLYKTYSLDHPQTSWASYANETIYKWLLSKGEKDQLGDR
jgi:predicted peptidase